MRLDYVSDYKLEVIIYLFPLMMTAVDNISPPQDIYTDQGIVMTSRDPGTSSATLISGIRY